MKKGDILKEMIKPDIIISWPRNADYPLWREMIHKERNRFNEVIVVFTETNYGENYKQFIRDAMFQDHVLFVDSPLPQNGEDWRNIAVNFGLIHSLHSEWIWFTEQDFFPLEGFWQMVDAYESTGVKAIVVKDEFRIHPCSILIKRKLLNELDKNFGIVPDKLDHFGLIQKQLEQRDEPLGIMPINIYEHMAGLSHNMRLIEEGQQPNHKPEAFKKYIEKCLQVSVPLDNRFKNVADRYLQDASTL